MLAGLQNVTFEFGARLIVKEATWHIHPGERIGLIGYNGTGKSTLLKVLVGEYSPSKGEVIRGRGTSIGYLHQDLLSFDTSESVLRVAMGAFERVLQLEKEIEELGKILEQKEDEALLMEYSEKLHEIDTLDGYNIHHKTEEVLQGLGFNNADLERPYQTFSGGWRMRVLLAKMILQKPDLLLLDEPTNHLDLPSIEWLEKYLVHYQGSVVIISHDRYFLDRMVTKIVELYQQQLHIYSGNYSYYMEEKVLRTELQQRSFENQQDYIRQQERFIERFKAKASKAAAAQSAMKRLDKLDRIEDVKVERPDLRINFSVNQQPGKILVTLKDVSKAFGNNVILEHTDAEINRGDKIALIGANGRGKSTALRIIAGTEPFTGERVWGHNVVESFYAQHQLEALDVNQTVLAEMLHCGSQKTEFELRTLLGCFLFSGDEVEKKIKVLSGGEKARVALAKVIVSKANFLLLDEPTNHLDMHSVNLLIDSLNRYEGSLLLVSHDRYFVQKTANKIWEIDENHQIKEFVGHYEEWVDWKNRMAARAAESAAPRKGSGKAAANEPAAKTAAAPAPPPSPAPKVSAPAPKPGGEPIDKEAKKELQKHQRRFEQVEAELAKTNARKAELEAALGSPDVYANAARFQETEKAYKDTVAAIERLNGEYEVVFEKLVELGGA
ncbi:ABC-F family ATP-binding cassette domain-containing protein [Dinghuibacter silviterrae]|uniref:ATP-binding cassette subfamily F protein 3 n=1 Tax=Dinghuibacter silviterrae TaxID=1539049 RepID=A0A4V3GM61_9BACT|nr:ABC-F family ATP-binding cassette domain-containing protein [Dinghuibacter silviterrae]TDX02223.1 ATP-binding cassette subfamily F protein 3 [Dinghuibacter silviterrae]